jgi:hypothetical protein
MPFPISAPPVVAALAIPLRQYLEAFSDRDALGELSAPILYRSVFAET